jgi:O-antigen/teichoic acid export membrane protein
MWLVTRRLLPSESWKRDPAETKALLRSSLNVFAANVCTVVVTQSDALVVSVSRDPKLAVQFVISRKAIDLVCLFATHISNSVMPALAHLHGAGDAKRMRTVSTLSLKVALSVALVGVGGAFLLNHSFVSLWVGEAFWAGSNLTGLLCLGGLTQVLTGALYSLLFAYGDISGASRPRIWEAILRLPLAFILGKEFGTLGVAVAAFLASVPTTIGLQSLRLLKKLDLARMEALGGALRFSAIIVIPTMAGWLGMAMLGDMGPALNLIFWGSGYGTVCAVLLLVFNRDLRSLAGDSIARIRGWLTKGSG